MKVVIYKTSTQETYTQIRNLKFAPETDVISSEIAINNFSVEIKTTSVPELGDVAGLFDDNGNLWAKYWITRAERLNPTYVYIEAESVLLLLDRIDMSPKMYEGDALEDVIEEIFERLSYLYSQTVFYELDSEFDNDTVTGFCPAQSARDRLQWVCFVSGACVRSFFSTKIEIVKAMLPITYFTTPDDTCRYVNESDVYWRPKVNYKEYITAVVVKAYSYADGIPSTTDEWVSDGNNVYIQTDQEFSATNSNIPRTVADKKVNVEDVTIINSSNVSTVLQNLYNAYFNASAQYPPYEFEAEILNPEGIEPGDLCCIPDGLGGAVFGNIRTMEFTFGRLNKAHVKLEQTVRLTSTGEGSELPNLKAAQVIIRYLYRDEVLKTITYYMPVGAVISIQTEYLDITRNSERVIFIPDDDTITVTVADPAQSTNEIDEPCSPALVYSFGYLNIYSVDEITETQQGTILEIA